MRGLLDALSLRQQLIALAVALMLAGLSVLVLDEMDQYEARQSLERISDDTLASLRWVKSVSDAYGIDIVGAAIKVRNSLMGWEQGARSIDRALESITRDWQRLERSDLSPEQRQMIEEVALARDDAAQAVTRLRQIMTIEDVHALGTFVDVELYPATDPVTTRLKVLSDLMLTNAQAVTQARGERAQTYRVWRFVISLTALLLLFAVGRNVVRNIYRGVENLVFMAERIRAHDYVAEPRYLPRGELGTVMQAVREMRGSLLDYEADLHGALEKAEWARRESERRQAYQMALLESAQAAIITTDAKGRVTAFNPFAERLLGNRAEDVVGRADIGVWHDPAEVKQLARDLLARGEHPPDSPAALLCELCREGAPPREWTLRRRDGARVSVLLATSAIYDDRGELLANLFIATDLSMIKQLESDLRESEARAQEASRAKSAFLAAMSHEIRTPMIGVTGMLEVLSHTELDEEQRRALNVIQHSADSLLQIIGDILDFSKIEAGKLEIAETDVDLRRLVANLGYAYMGAASSKGLRLEFSVDEKVGPAHLADGVRLRQVLSNFISNSIKFTENGSIRIQLESLGMDGEREKLLFRVRDTGIGISAEAQQRLFQPFEQAEAHTARKFGGTGLGLAISRRLAELMHAKIRMQSSPGNGTTMLLELDLARGDPTRVPADSPASRDASALTLRPAPGIAAAERERSLILLADDHPTNRAVVSRQLGLAGFAVETAEDGEQALALWRSGRYALVLTDVHMPRMDGYALTAAIREEEKRRTLTRTPVVALTANAVKGEAERCLGAGMDDFLTKPVSIAQLSNCIRRWLPHVKFPDTLLAEGNAVGEVDQSAPLDHALLDTLSGNDPAARAELVEDFIAASRRDLDELTSAQSATDFETLARSAHKIRGAARMVGALQLAESAAGLEQAARDHRADRIASLADSVRAEIERLERWNLAQSTV